jgi:hypothetical protein
MARSRLTDTPIKKRLNIPESVAAEVDLELFDPVLGKPRFGGWSGLVTQLLRDWLAERAKEKGQSDATK